MAKYCGSLAVLAATVFGLFCKWCQLFVPGRMADGMDALANSVGAVFGFAVVSMRVKLVSDSAFGSKTQMLYIPWIAVTERETSR
jgi:VanZ family protein